MDQLEYVFDKDLIEKKGQTNTEAYVKIQFQKLMQRTQEQQEIFNVIWGNTNGLPQSLFGSLTQANARNEFKRLINTLDNELFKFFKTR